MGNFFNWLRLSSAPASNLDAPETAYIHREIILKKLFLKKVYLDFYAGLKSRIPDGSKFVVEIGSGSGFIKEVIPNAVTSDVISLPWIDQVFSASKMPFEDSAVDAFVMVNVFHHLPDAQAALAEMDRCLRPGGSIIMIEPANTPFNRFVTRRFHHEEFDTSAGWTLKGDSRLSTGNEALPWIVFQRDRARFEQIFPELSVRETRLFAPFRYLASGGLSYRALLPSLFYSALKVVEAVFSPLNSLIAGFQIIVVRKAAS